MAFAEGPFIRTLGLWREKIPSAAAYPYALPAVRDLEGLELHPRVTFFVGENGTGKSTVLEAIAVALGMNAEGGGKNFNFSTRESHSGLHEFLRLRRSASPRDTYFFRAESYYNLASEIDRLGSIDGRGVVEGYGPRSLHEQSHGESFLALLNHRLRGPGLYLFDEPEAALSPTRQLAFLSTVHDLVRGGSQLIIATHAPIIMAYPDAWVYEFSDGIRRVAYTETEHYKVTRAFVSRPEVMLKELLEREE